MALIGPLGAPGPPLKLVVLTPITINEVEKLRKWPSVRDGWGVLSSTYFVNGARIFSLSLFLSLALSLE